MLPAIPDQPLHVGHLVSDRKRAGPAAGDQQGLGDVGGPGGGLVLEAGVKTNRGVGAPGAEDHLAMSMQRGPRILPGAGAGEDDLDPNVPGWFCQLLEQGTDLMMVVG